MAPPPVTCPPVWDNRLGPYVSPGLYSMADSRLLVASCLRCHERWREPGNPTLAHIPAERDGESVYAFAARHDEATHGKRQVVR